MVQLGEDKQQSANNYHLMAFHIVIIQATDVYCEREVCAHSPFLVRVG